MKDNKTCIARLVDRYFLDIVNCLRQGLSDTQCHETPGLQDYILEGWSNLADGPTYPDFPYIHRT